MKAFDSYSLILSVVYISLKEGAFINENIVKIDNFNALLWPKRLVVASSLGFGSLTSGGMPTVSPVTVAHQTIK